MYKKLRLIIGVATMLSWAGQGNAQETNNTTLPLDAFASLPAMTQATVPLDGSKLAIIRATSKDGDYIVEIRPTNDLAAEPVRLGASRMEITDIGWLNNDKLLVNFRQNIQDGNDNYWVTKAAIVNGDGKGDWKIPFPKENRANFEVLSVLADDPDHILLTYDINNNRIPDVIKYNINTGSTQTILRGNETVSNGFIPDPKGEIRAGSGYDRATNSIKQYARVSGETDWKEIYSNSPNDRENWDFLYFSQENTDEVYVKANLGEDTTGIYTYNIRTGKYSERLFGLKSLDVDSVMLGAKSSNRGQLLGFSYTSKHPTRYFLDANEEAIYQGIEALFPDKFVSLVSRSEDDNAIVIRTSSDKDPGSYYLMSDKKKLDFLGERSPLIKPEHLSDVKFVKYTARDGRKIPAYITVPKGKGPFPAVVMPHGGPWVRDVVIYDEWSQLLAHHGYIVIQPQYRGSTGFGLDHWKAGDKKWGLEMQDDNDDAALYLVEKGLADKDKLAIFGWSYGGYAAFAGSMRKNNIYQCSIAGAGVTDLSRITATLFGASRYGRIYQAPTVKGVSPIEHVKDLNVPLLIIHGDIDQRVPVEQSRLFVDALEKLDKDFKYVELKGADHFSNTLYYRHKTEFYTELLDWLKNKC
ncbi:alpha/beta hydrolase family protein [Paraglaciecola hydrolytica]|uniref:Peptidase S9 n=1 Tax=Paraglaciecola hydrolytica TaxID=1799789 RepID=A0A136A334_9ALTE|nr:prolyl oligopeptidase family serine peptidase [Paraglaciecola hydrolytica]KXI29623.1 peptidase S9 [Paraglaciecola hydrolytica]